MAEQETRTYKLIELVGTSDVSYAEATKNAINRASETLRGLGWFQVTELRGLIEDGNISEYQLIIRANGVQSLRRALQAARTGPQATPVTPECAVGSHSEGSRVGTNLPQSA